MKNRVIFLPKKNVTIKIKKYEKVRIPNPIT